MVMSQVLINDTTLTSMADAIREKNMSNPEYMKVTETITFTTGIYQQKSYYFPFSDVRKVRFKAHFSNNTEKSMPILIFAGFYSYYTSDREDPNAIVINPADSIGIIDYEETFEGNSIILKNKYNDYSHQGVQFDIELTALDENGQEIGQYSPSEMINAIKAPSHKWNLIVQGGLWDDNQYEKLHLTAEDFKGLTRIRNSAFQNCYALKSVEIPEGIREIGRNAFDSCGNLKMDILTLPSTLEILHPYAFWSDSMIRAFKILNKDSVINNVDSNEHFTKGQTIYVPSNLYEDYKNHSYWGMGADELNLIPYGEYVSDPKISSSLLFNQSKSFTIELSDFKTAPTFSITSSDQNIITISNAVVNDDNTAITFDVNSLTTEGNATINISIQGQEMSFDFTGNISVYETIPESTYEVVAVENASYGFELNDNGYYESKNKGVSSSYAICQVNISNMMGRKVYFDCINSGESNYDFGILSKVNTTLSLSNNTDSSSNYFKSFKGQSSTNVQTVEYTDAIDNCFIQVKFIKDTSGDQDNDTLQFKVRFEE